MAKKSLQIQQLIQPVIEAMGYELFGIEYAAHGVNGLLRIYIERPDGITLDDCAKVSEQISAILDVEEPIAGKYTLEVSSPGIERPLFTLAHFQRYVGHHVHIRTFAPIDNQRNFSGVIESVNENNIVLTVEGKVLSLPFESITKANLRFEGRLS
jgi:ribosome maturation factor RimP